jgi:hypothetical protein
MASLILIEQSGGRGGRQWAMRERGRRAARNRNEEERERKRERERESV